MWTIYPGSIVWYLLKINPETMKKLLLSFCLLCSLSSWSQSNMAIEGGFVYRDGQFEKMDIYVEDGNFSFEKPEQIDTLINISNKYVIPPFGEAHTHNLDRQWQMGFLPQQYAKEGTIYIQNLTSKLKETKALRPYFEKDSTIDVTFAHQGLSTTLGHPFMAYEPFTMGIEYGTWKENMDSIRKSRLDEDNAYIFIDSDEDLKSKLPAFFDASPDVVKIYLLDSENFEENYKDSIIGDHGLPLDLAKKIIKESHNRGLKVYAHIETAYDFEQGIKAGVDYFAHMPGYGWDGDPATRNKYFVPDSILELAAEKQVGVVPTVGAAMGYPTIDSIGKRTLVRDFLRRFKSHKGKILIGADSFNKTLSGEIQTFIDMEIYDNSELLTILCYDTPRAIFPDRKIAKLESGYEGSFIVLEGNPLEDINALMKVELVVKQGYILN